MSDPNLFAHVAVVAGLAVVALAPRSPLLVGLALLTASVCVLLSGSRTGMGGLLLGMLLLPAVLPRSGTVRKRALLALSVLGAAALLVAATTGSRLLAPLADDVNLRARVQVWETAWELALERPLLGFGHERLPLEYEFAVPDEPGPRYRNNHAHNVFLHLAAGYGWLVTIAFATACAALMVRLWRAGASATLVVIAVVILLNQADLTLFHSGVFLPAWAATVMATREGG